MLSCILAASWSAALWNDGHVLDQLPTVEVIVQTLGAHVTSLWMAAVAVVPVLGMLTNALPLRIAGATLGLVTWTVLLAEMALGGIFLQPAMAGCLVGVLACLNADMRLAHQVFDGSA